MRPGGARGQLPLVGEQVLEEVTAPPRRRRRPGDLDAAGDRVPALTAAEAVLPAEALLVEGSAFGLGADVLVRVGRAVGLAERVPARDQCDGLLVVHRHPPERLADVACRGQRVRFAVRALRVDVDEAHLNGGQRGLELPVTGVALVTEPGALRAPVDVLVGLPDVRPAAGVAEGLESHRLQRTVAREDHQVGPRDLAAVLLLHRPEQPARLVEVAVVGPAVQRREPLHAGARAAAAVIDAVGARAVPRHPDHQRAVVAEVGGPPLLRRRQHLVHIACQRIEVQAVELRGVVEALAHGVGHGGVLPEDLQVELVRPPVAVGRALGRVVAATGRDGAPARALIVHLADHGVRSVRHMNPSGVNGVLRKWMASNSRGTGPSRSPRPRRSRSRGRRRRSGRERGRRRSRHRR